MLGRGLLTRVAAYAVFALGFWLLFQGFDRPSPALGILGSAGVLLGMYLMVGNRREGPRYTLENPEAEAENPADSLPENPDGQDQRF